MKVGEGLCVWACDCSGASVPQSVKWYHRLLQPTCGSDQRQAPKGFAGQQGQS